MMLFGTFRKNYNDGQLFDTLPIFLFTTSETKRNYW